MIWERWVAPRGEHSDIGRQERLVNILSLGGTLAGLAYLVVLLIDLVGSRTIELASAVGAVLCVVLSLAAYRLSRSGRVQGSAVLIVVAASLIGLYAVYARGALSVSVVVLAPAVVFAGMAIGSRGAWITTLIEFALFVVLTIAGEQHWWGYEPPIGHSPQTGVALTAVSLGLLALVTVQSLRVMEESLQKARDRETALRTMDQEKSQLLAELRSREEATRRLVDMVRELGSPIIPLAKGVIAMPLIGALDSRRAQQVMEALLRGVSTHRAEVAIVDITGVPVVDTAVVGALVRAMVGVQLLGTKPVLTGIRSEVAQTIVGLGIDMSGIVTRATLQEGLDYALQPETGA